MEINKCLGHVFDITAAVRRFLNNITTQPPDPCRFLDLDLLFLLPSPTQTNPIVYAPPSAEQLTFDFCTSKICLR